MTPRMVYVVWRDARDCAGEWASPEDFLADSGCAECYSVGWLVEDTPLQVVLTHNVAKSGRDISYGGGIAIPKGWVTCITDLRL